MGSEPQSSAHAARLRVGATSFVYPASWADNVARLAGRVQDIELLLFEPGAYPSRAELEQIAKLADAGHTYTVHTPLTASLASEDAARRMQGVSEVNSAIDWTRCLAPAGWVVHVYLGDHEGDEPPDDLDAWRSRARDSLRAVVELAGSAERVCVESLDYDFELIAPVVIELGLSIAWDVGHFHRDARSWRPMLERHFERIRIIQWHGTDATGRDHRSLAFADRGDVHDLLVELVTRGYDGVLTLEVFREMDFDESLCIVMAELAQLVRP